MNEYAMMGFIMYRTQGTGVTVDQINAVIEAYKEYKQERQKEKEENTFRFDGVGEIECKADGSYHVKKDNALIELRPVDIARFVAVNIDSVHQHTRRSR